VTIDGVLDCMTGFIDTLYTVSSINEFTNTNPVYSHTQEVKLSVSQAV
jgi:hypothetical protein